MRALFFVAALFALSTASAQYYYKDIMGTKETADLIRHYQANKVNRVVLASTDGKNEKSDAFYVEQSFSPAKLMLKTTTRSNITNESFLTSWADANGNVIKTVDSSDAMVSTTVYTYDQQGQLLSSTSTSVDSLNTTNEKEEHLWQYNNNKPARMLRIKNSKDTTVVNFVVDEQGNVVEERAVRKGVAAEPVYYYYDNQNRMTDIVRYNKKARRLLPEYLFEYSPANQVIQKITVPSDNDNYLIWRYKYNDKGLKIKEAIYNKQKELTGTVEYQYSFGS